MPPPQAGSGAAGSGAEPGSVTDPKLPAAQEVCPKLATGDVKLLGANVKLYVGERPAAEKVPLILYWHGTGSIASEVEFMLGGTFQAILDEGGVIASFDTSTGTGESLFTGTWTTGDFALADELVACAVDQLGVDARRIYVMGCSAGAVQASTMLFVRSSYVAAGATNSGGIVTDYALQEPGHVPPVMTTHGPSGTDVVIVDFAETSLRIDRELVASGGFAIDCEHSGGHCGSPAEIKDAQWDFLKAHPFGVSPEPYAGGLPRDFPSQCKIIQP